MTAMLVIAITAFLAWFFFVYNLTGWDAKRFTGESLTIFGYSVPIMLGVVTPTVIYGTKPIWDSYPRKEEKKTSSETIIERYENHTKELIEKLDGFHNKLNSDDDFPFVFTWWHTLERFESQKEYLQHLITGKPNLYDIMSELIASEGKGDLFKQFNEQMGEFVKAVLAGGESLKGCCSSCKGMFPPDEVAEFERQFTELENSEVYKKLTHQS